MTTRTPRPAHVVAREIVTDPDRFADQPAILGLAWAALMAARGRRVDLDRLGQPGHLVDRTGACEGLSDIMAGRAMRIRAAIAARGGATRPAPLILRDAVPPLTLPGA